MLVFSAYPSFNHFAFQNLEDRTLNKAHRKTQRQASGFFCLFKCQLK
ncbi:hypothetical protein D7V19_17860 [Vibrio parahaemolyticus]|nr:hypothetical protein [Vibrio parahaemolyticus]EGR1479511.1 hypothetical protein [Vibrio parahaemolyticus]MRD95977.1 hypothetical protein [Vibrio parahaemolyticus]TPA28087.1 hypothetical protein DXJ84_06830 [Vibrio parahaemolyticus]